MTQIEVKNAYDLLGEKIHAEFMEYREKFLKNVSGGVFHDYECGVFAIKADLNEFFYSEDIEDRISEKQAEELLNVRDLLDELTDIYLEFERDWQEPIHYAVEELVGGRK